MLRVFEVYANFHQNLSLRKGNICGVKIITEQPSYIFYWSEKQQLPFLKSVGELSVQ